MAEIILAVRRSARLLAATLLLGLACSSPASGQVLPVTVSASVDKIQVQGASTPVRLKWEVHLGPTRYLVIETTSAILKTGNGQRIGTFGTQRKWNNINGRIMLNETVRISVEDLRRAREAGSFIIEREFEAIGPQGNIAGVGRQKISIIRPTLRECNKQTPFIGISLCNDDFTVDWCLKIDGNATFKIKSEKGEFFDPSPPNSPNLPDNFTEINIPMLMPDGEETRMMNEQVSITSGVKRAARGDVYYKRTFTLLGPAGFSDVLNASAKLVLEDSSSPLIFVDPQNAFVALAQPESVRLTWMLQDASSCQSLKSDEGVFWATLDGQQQKLGTIEDQLTFTGMNVEETIRVPTTVLRQASELGVDSLVYVRKFQDKEYDWIQAQGTLEIQLGGTLGDFAIQRLALQFDDGEHFRLAEQRERLSATAEITYTGSGLLEATWEVADPSSTSGEPVFRPLEVVRQQLAAEGRVELPSPALPTGVAGTYAVRLNVRSPEIGEPPTLAYQVDAGAGVFVSGVWPPPPPWNEAPRVRAGDPMRERELVAFTLNMEEAKRLDQIGLRTKSRYSLDALGLVVSVLRVPAGASVGALVDELRRRHPTLWIDANQAYESQQMNTDFDLSKADLKAAFDAIDWGEEQKKCSSNAQIGIVDTPINEAVLVLGNGKRETFILEGETPATDHGDKMAGLLFGWKDSDMESLLLHEKAEEIFFAAGALGGPDELNLSSAFRHLVTLDRLARAFDWMMDARDPNETLLINVGIAGRPSLGLNLITWMTASSDVFLIAPYGPTERTSYPAAYDRVIGTAEMNFEPSWLKDYQVVFAPKIRMNDSEKSCGNSCSAIFVTAALWVASKDAAGHDLQTLRMATTESREGENFQDLRAPKCNP